VHVSILVLFFLVKLAMPRSLYRVPKGKLIDVLTI
jgi:hypothetical protein